MAKKIMKSASKKAASERGQKMTPLSDRVLVRPLSAEESGQRSPSGIIIPETVSKEKPEQGIVVAVGAGKRDENGARIPMEVKVGDRVMFSKYGYDEIKLDGVEHYVLSESGILAIITRS